MKEDAPSTREKKVKRGNNKGPNDTVQRPHTPAAVVMVDPFLLEEEEAQKRNSEEDYNLFKEIVGDMKNNLKKIRDLRRNKNCEAEVAECKVETSMLFLDLKKLNRLDKHRWKKNRDSVNDVKQKVDNFQLQQQNLLYEVMHLEKEVTKCLEFRSKDEDIDLVSLEEFHHEAPPSISRVDTTKNDPHQERLAQLEWELEQRKRLAEKLEETEKLKQNYIKEIEKKRECLDSLMPTLKNIIQASQPLHGELGIPLQMTEWKHKAAEFLPRPLYVLYVQGNAYRETCDKEIEVDIEGKVEEAKVFQTKMEEIEEDSADSDQEEVVPKKRHRRATLEKRGSDSKKYLTKHPLSVNVVIRTSKDISLSLKFSFLIHLRVITTTITEIKTNTPQSSIASQALQPSSLLECLFPNDTGKESPNPGTSFILEKLKIEKFESLISQVGYPFIWAQKLAGLEFLSLEGNGQTGNPGTSNFQNIFSLPIKKQHTISASFFETCINTIRERLLARTSLHKQLLALEQRNVSIPLEILPQFPPKISCRLKEWSVRTWDEVENHPSSKLLVECGLIREEVPVYRLTLERGSANLKALVLISPDYPKVIPIFLLTLNWKGQKTSTTDSGVWELERDINVVSMDCVLLNSEAQSNFILSCQIQQLLVNFDIYLETDGDADSIEGPKEFSQTGAYTRIAMGRNRSKPFKYLQKLSLFTQR